MKTNLFKGIIVTTVMVTLCVACSSDDEAKVDESKAYVEKTVVNNDGSIAIPSNYQAMNEQNNDFTWRIFSYMASENTDNASNMLISPYSLAVDLAMLNNGAAGKSQSELKQILNFDGFSVDDINNYFAILTRGLAQVDGSTTFASANALWYDESITMKKAFSSTLESWYKAETHASAMKTQQTLDAINLWASNNTNGMIEKFFKNIDEIPDVATLLNAIYLKSAWEKPFSESQTYVDNFIQAGKSNVDAHYMQQTNYMNYAKGNSEEIVFMPLGDKSKFEMFFALPNKNVSLASAIDDLQTSWSEITSTATEKAIMISLPRFTSEYESQWKDCLQSMGCTKIFSLSDADFSSMTSTQDVYVDNIKQKTKMTVDEGGVECAAVTGSQYATSSGDPLVYVEIKYNRPFVYGLREKSTGVILFVGYVNNPGE